MIPHTLVLKPGLVIHSIYNGYWFWGRPSTVDLWHDLRDATREIRPDWALDTPGCARPGSGRALALPRLRLDQRTDGRASTRAETARGVAVWVHKPR